MMRPATASMAAGTSNPAWGSRVAVTTTVSGLGCGLSCCCAAAEATTQQAIAATDLIARRASLDLGAGGGDDLGPLLDFGFDDVAEIVGAALERHPAQL